MHNLLKISQQTSWQVLGKVVTSVSTFIILGIVTRNYGKEGTGVFTLALTYLSIFYILADFGFNAHELRNLESQKSNGSQKRISQAKTKSEWNKLLGTRLVWSGTLVVIAVGLLPFWPFSTPVFTLAVLFGSLAIIASSVFTTSNLIFQSKLRYDLSVLASSFGTLIGLVVFVFLSISKSPIYLLILAQMVSWIFISLAALLLIRKFFINVVPRFDKRYTINLFKDSWPIATTLSLNVLYFRADSFMISYFKPISDVGIYNIAYSVFQSALVLPTFIMNAYYPLMIKSLGKFKLVAFGLLGLSLLGTFLTLILAPFVISIITGGGFSESITSLQILSLGFPAYFLSSLLMWVLIVKGRYKVMFLLYTSGCLFNIILNLIFIPQYSFIAASWTTVVSEYFILAMQVVVLMLERRKEQ